MLEPLLSTRIQLVVVCPDKKLMVDAGTRHSLS